MSPAMLLFNYLLNAFWQLPLVFCAAWLAVRLTRHNGPQWEHCIWVGALFTELLLPFGQLNLKLIAAYFLSLFAPAAPSAAASVSISTGPAAIAAPAWQLSPFLITFVLAAYAALILYFTGRLVWRLLKTSTMRRNAHTIASEDYPVLHKFFSTRRAPLQLLVSQSVSSPAIVGFLHPALLLPPGFLDRTAATDLQAALAHEFAHLRRRDYAKNLFYEVLTLPITWHPVIWLTRARIAESREILCDHLAAHVTFGPHDYACALLRLASQQSIRKPQTIHAIGIFDTQSLERRIMKLTQSQIRNTSARRAVTLAACTILALATGAFALGLHVDAATGSGSGAGIGIGSGTGPGAFAHDKSASSQPASVSPAVIAGNRISGENPKYPVMAKKAKIQGEVVLHAVISKQGNIESLHVVSGPAMLRNSALDAVRTWRYKPYIHNGHPVTVDTTINVIYQLGGGSFGKSETTAAIQQQLAEAQAQLAEARANLSNTKLDRAQLQKQMAQAQQQIQKAQETLKKQKTILTINKH